MLKKLIKFFKTYRLRLGWYVFEEDGEDMIPHRRRAVLWSWEEREELEELEALEALEEAPILPENATPYQKRAYELACLVDEFKVNALRLTHTHQGDLANWAPGKTVQVRRGGHAARLPRIKAND